MSTNIRSWETPRDLNRLCYLACLAQVGAGSLIALLLIWLGVDNDAAWRCIYTMGWLLLASLVTAGTNSMFAKMPASVVNRLGFAGSLASIALGTVMGFVLIWIDSMQTFAWKSIASATVLFFASMISVGINSAFNDRAPSTSDNHEPAPSPRRRRWEANGELPTATIVVDDKVMR